MNNQSRSTRVVTIDVSKIGRVKFSNPKESFLEDWTVELSSDEGAAHLRQAAQRLRDEDTPVAFPTETVYGLGADARRSSAVRGIYAAKQRPSDNPLIVHVSSLAQIRRLVYPFQHGTTRDDALQPDPIPLIYRPLIARFWPGPLTILLPLPNPSPLAPEATASLPTFAVRMPSSLLALLLIHLADVPLAAPSANASTKPSPTTAEHVLNDLSGRIDLILDGGPCEVGVESTVVDGLSNPPVILRPGGISADMLRQCPGWEEVVVGYKDAPERGVPRAPGMKYKHYSPRAKVILVEGCINLQIVNQYRAGGSIGILATKTWCESDFTQNELSRTGVAVMSVDRSRPPQCPISDALATEVDSDSSAVNGCFLSGAAPIPTARLLQRLNQACSLDENMQIWFIALGKDMEAIARGLFSALRELDQKHVDAIFVESIEEGEGDAAAAVMNRLDKAAEVRIRT